MFGWILLGILSILGILCIISGKDGGIVFGIIVLLMMIVIPLVVNYFDTIAYPEKYVMLKETIQQTKDLITNTELNLADVEMNKSLAELIKERNILLFEVRINNISPWTLFKIDLNR